WSPSAIGALAYPSLFWHVSKQSPPHTELTLFVWREFCERADPPAVRGMDRQQAIAGLRRAFGYGVQPRTSPGPDSEPAQGA
ncbi:hypothetical protein ACRVA2_32815, partial [Pseudomonas aeruginosa]